MKDSSFYPYYTRKTNVKYSTKQPIRSYILIIIIVMKIFQNLWIRLLELKV